MNLKEVFNEMPASDKLEVAKAISILDETGFMQAVGRQNKEHMLAAVVEVAHMGSESQRLHAACVRYTFMQDVLRNLHDLTTYLEE